MRMKLITKRVKSILERYPIARDSDKALIVYYLKEYHGINAGWLLVIDESLEGITRARRLLQQHGEYQAIGKIKEIRKEKEQEMIEIVKQWYADGEIYKGGT